MSWEKLTLEHLRGIARHYNKEVKIMAIAKMKKNDLIEELKKHLTLDYEKREIHHKTLKKSYDFELDDEKNPQKKVEKKEEKKPEKKVEKKEEAKKNAPPPPPKVEDKSYKKEVVAKKVVQAREAIADAKAIKPPEVNKVDYLKDLLKEVESQFSKYHIGEILRDPKIKKKVFDLSREIAKASGDTWFAMTEQDLQTEKGIRNWLQGNEYTGFRTVSHSLEKKIAQAEGKPLPQINLNLLKERLIMMMSYKYFHKTRAKGYLTKFVNEKVKTNADFYRLVRAFSSSDAMDNDSISEYGRDLTEIFKNQTLAYDEFKKFNLYKLHDSKTAEKMYDDDVKEVKNLRYKAASASQKKSSGGGGPYDKYGQNVNDYS